MSYQKGLGIPYLGSKRKLAKPIADFILEQNPNTKYVYDLFGGGGAFTLEMVQRPQIDTVFYNELNTGIVELFKDLLNNGVDDKYYQWVDKETFHQHKNNDDWFGGFCKVVYSFGNNQKDYLYGVKITEDKRLAHEYIVNNCLDSKIKLEEKYNVILPELNGTIQERRLQLTRFFKKLKDGGVETKLYNMQHLNMVENLTRVANLERVANLKRVTNLKRVANLEISNLSYDQVKITTPVEETIIYLDPPYKGTRQYQKTLDYNKLTEYILNSPYKIYVSSYEYPELTEVWSKEHRATVMAQGNNKVVEKLFCNKV